jgi:hypothetical protein
MNLRTLWKRGEGSGARGYVENDLFESDRWQIVRHFEEVAIVRWI